MFKYTIINDVRFKIDNNILDKVLLSIEKLVGKKQNWNINIVFTDKETIRELNNKYRNIDKDTDVLSFHYFDSFEWLNREETVWEILMYEEKVKKQWKDYWLWVEKEFYKLFIHSILHILWYDHENDIDYKIMQKIENKIWNEVFEK